MKSYVMTDREKQAIKNVLFFAYRNAPGEPKTDAQINASIENDIRLIIANRKRKQIKWQTDKITNAINELISNLPPCATFEAWSIEDETGTHFELGITLPNIRVR